MGPIGFVEVALKWLDWQCDTGVEFDFHLIDVAGEISTFSAIGATESSANTKRRRFTARIDIPAPSSALRR